MTMIITIGVAAEAVRLSVVSEEVEASEEAEEEAGETQCAKRSVFPKELVESLNSVVI